MPKYLQDGETRPFKINDHLKVVAERVDSETPYVHLQFDSDMLYHLHSGTNVDHRISLTDVDAERLIDALQKALNILPTSK